MAQVPVIDIFLDLTVLLSSVEVVAEAGKRQEGESQRVRSINLRFLHHLVAKVDLHGDCHDD